MGLFSRLFGGFQGGELVRAKAPIEPGEKTVAKEALQWAVENGSEVDDFYVEKSREAGYPFYAETEEEWNTFLDPSQSPFVLYPASLIGILIRYVVYPAKNLVKAQYILEQIEQGAEEGNLEYQAFLMYEAGVRGMFSDDERSLRKKGFETLYRERFDAALAAKDPHALFAQACFSAPLGSMERFDLYVEAGENGLGDGYWEARNAINSLAFERGKPYPQYGETIWYLERAAGLGTGVFVQKAKEWYEEAVEEHEADGFVQLTPDRVRECFGV